MKKYFLFLAIALSACNKNETLELSDLKGKGEILFISRRLPNNAEWQMFLMNTDGSNQHLVTDDLVTCTTPALSHNGQSIAYTTYSVNDGYQLKVIGTDGQNKKILSSQSNFCGEPTWSPDDQTIAFIKGDYPSQNIFTVNPNTGAEKQITSQGNNVTPEFLDNDILLYHSFDDTFSGIYKKSIAGGDGQLITPADKAIGAPKVSPDGKQVAVTFFYPDGSQVGVMNADGSDLKQITNSASPVYFDAGFQRDGNASPSWSPDSKMIVYLSYSVNGSQDVFVINANGKNNRALTNTKLRDENPGWSADGRYILFSSNRDLSLSAEIYIMMPDGGSQIPLTGFAGDDIYPVFINK